MVCFFVPTPPADAPAARASWFGPAGTEESRVAYVAMTRAKKALMVVIPKLGRMNWPRSHRAWSFSTRFHTAARSKVI